MENKSFRYAVLFHIFFAVFSEEAVAFHRFDALEALDGHSPALFGVLGAVVVRFACRAFRRGSTF